MQQNIFLVIVSALAVLCIFNFIINVTLLRKLNAMRAREQSLMRDIESAGLEGLLKETLRKISDMDRQFEEVKFFEQKLLEKLPPCIQKVGLVRFNAFSDVGGEQSFALALLDGRDKGVVLSSLYGRSEARVYAKIVEGGQSPHALSEEEQKALTIAKNQPPSA